VQVKIEKLIYGGEGLGHQDGHTVFVPFVLPDEVVTVRAREQKKKFIRGELVSVDSASPQRVAPLCRHFGACGGCNYQHIPYQAQLAHKAGILRETLSRIGRVAWNGPIQTHASPPLGYRNRAQWKVRKVADRAQIGYFRGGTSALLAAEECPVLSPLLAATLERLRQLLAEGALPSSLLEVEAFADTDDSRLLLNFSFTEFPKGPSRVASEIRGAITGAEGILLHEASRDRFEILGPGFVRCRVNEFDFEVGHLSFFQTNRFLLSELQQAVTANVRGDLALDLYCGVGLFTLPIARQFSRVVAVESNSAAVRNLEANLGSRSSTVHVMQNEVAEALQRITDSPDVVVLDPPRAGVEKSALEKLAALSAREIRYLSCDPATLARDLALLTGRGYTVSGIHLFDLFPQTFHIETLAVLNRST